jgi:hypothetical protein
VFAKMVTKFHNIDPQVKVFPTTSIPIYVNMFTTVMKTYIYLLSSYLAFLMSFAYSFFLIFGAQVLKLFKLYLSKIFI